MLNTERSGPSVWAQTRPGLGRAADGRFQSAAWRYRGGASPSGVPIAHPPTRHTVP